MSAFLEELNAAQRQAVEHGDGPLLIVAGAGTGKTRTLVCRVAHLIQRGVAPERILLLTFTRRAAAEMLARAGRLTQAAAAGKVWGGTFHAAGNRLLRMYGQAIGLSNEFTVADESDSADMMNLLRSELGFSKNKRRFPRKATLAKIYSRTVNAQEKLTDVLQKNFPWCLDEAEGIGAIFKQYLVRKRENNVLDYDDLLLYWRLLAESKEVGPRLNRMFDHILVDEYQDTNAIQAHVLQAMRIENKNITVVGDDAQSIYSFRAATVRNILDFPAEYPGTTVVALEQNYRSLVPILDASNAVMAEARERYTKNLWSGRESDLKPVLYTCVDESQQTDIVCDNVLAHREQEVMLMHQAVLFRAGHHSAHLEVELARRNIPFHKYGGLKFIEAAHIKDMLAVLRIMENPHDEMSWFRVLQLIEGVGPRTASRIMDELGVRRRAGAADDGDDSRSPLTRLVLDPPRIGSGSAEQWASLIKTIAACEGLRVEPATTDRLPADGDSASRNLASLTRTQMAEPSSAAKQRGRVKDQIARPDESAETGHENEGGGSTGKKRSRKSNESEQTRRTLVRESALPVAVQVERVRRFYEPIFERLYDNPTVRLRDIEQLEGIAAGYRARGRFITDLTLDPPSATSDLAQPPHLDEDYLVLSTIHSAKGCEWKVVHILHAADGMMPSDMATGSAEEIDEERRLFYVAMTRAKDHLYIYFPLRYYHHRFGKGDAHNYGQLTRFITPAARELFEQRFVGESEDDARYSGKQIDHLENRLNELWG